MTDDGGRGWRDPGLLILISLAGGPRHGFGMLEDIEGFSGRRLGPGTLYGALERLGGLQRLTEVAATRRNQSRATQR